MKVYTSVPGSRVIALARHVETDKNLADIHGRSALSGITPMGQTQARLLSCQVIRDLRGRIDGVWATPTPQAAESAKLVARLTALPYLGELGLAPADIGVASGLSSDALRSAHPAAFRSLDLFRARAISGSELRITGAEAASTLSSRLSDWWVTEGAETCPGRLVIGSSSTVLMLAHHLNGVSPTEPSYRYLPTHNGSMRVWYEEGGS